MLRREEEVGRVRRRFTHPIQRRRQLLRRRRPLPSTDHRHEPVLTHRLRPLVHRPRRIPTRQHHDTKRPRGRGFRRRHMDLYVTRESIPGNLGTLRISVLVDYNKKSGDETVGVNDVPSSTPSVPSFGLTNRHEENVCGGTDDAIERTITDDGVLHSLPPSH